MILAHAARYRILDLKQYNTEI